MVNTTNSGRLRHEAPAEATAGSASVEETLRGAGEHVLVVEDNEKLRAVLLRQLVELGYRVIEAENALNARKLIDSGTDIDLLLTDIVMPGKVDGCQLAREFIAARPGGRVLLTSGFPGTRVADLDDFGASLRLLDKPYRKQDLACILREVLAEPAPAD